MAKRIRLDFSKVEERSGWNTKHIPEGLHEMEIVAVDDKEANDGTDMLTYALVPTDPRYKTRRFPWYCKIQPNQLFKIRDLFVAAGIPVPKKALNIDPDKPIGKLVAAEITDATGQYEGRSEVNGIYELSILGDGGSSPSDDDEDDEEYDEDEVDEDYEDEPEEDEEEEEVDYSTSPCLSSARPSRTSARTPRGSRRPNSWSSSRATRTRTKTTRMRTTSTTKSSKRTRTSSTTRTKRTRRMTKTRKRRKLPLPVVAQQPRPRSPQPRHLRRRPQQHRLVAPSSVADAWRRPTSSVG